MQMRTFVLRFAALTVLLLAVGGCTDAVTLPDNAGRAPDVTAVAASQDAAPSALCCDPIIVIVPRCDPWMSLDWCEGEGGNCASSQPVIGYPDAYLGVSSCIDGGGGGGSGDGRLPGGGGTTPKPNPCPDYGCTPPPTTCNPQYDPDCNQPLTAQDTATIRTAIQRHMKPASQFTDPVAAQQCAELMNEFNRLYQAGNVFRGNSDTPPNDPLTDQHVGAYDPASGTIHFEPSSLDKANQGDRNAIRNLFNTALHEAGHSLGKLYTPPLWMGSHDLYMEAPYSLLSPGTNSCITNW